MACMRVPAGRWCGRGTLWRECVQAAVFVGLDDARRRIASDPDPEAEDRVPLLASKSA
jgi:hypothetical protein